MAGDWLKCNFDLWDHRCTQAIAHELGLDVDTVVGKFMRLWAWAQKQTATGKVKPCTPTIIDATARQEGFAKAMENAGWLKVGEGWVEFVRWDSHNSKGAKERALDQQRKRRNLSGSFPDGDRKVSGKSRYQRQIRSDQIETRPEGQEIHDKSGQEGSQPPEGASPIRLDLTKGGLTAEQAEEVVTHPKFDDAKVRHALAQMARFRSGGKVVRNPFRFVLTQAGMELGVKAKHTSALQRVRADAARLREGAKA